MRYLELIRKLKLVDEEKREKQILTFGPLSVHPAFYRKEYGKALLKYSFAKAKEMSYDVIVIFGNPDNYVSQPFEKLNIARRNQCRCVIETKTVSSLQESLNWLVTHWSNK